MDDLAEAAAYAGAGFARVNAAFVSRLLELTAHLEHAHVQAIDLGTGPGDIAIRVARERALWRILGVDAAEPMLTIARRAAQPHGNLSFRQCDAKATGLSAHSFDVVFSNSLLHHLPDPVPMWREIQRLAHPGTVVFLRDLLRPESPEEARRIVQTYAAAESVLLQEEFYRSLLAAFTIEEIQGQLRAAGFESLAVQRTSDRHVDILGRISAAP